MAQRVCPIDVWVTDVLEKSTLDSAISLRSEATLPTSLKSLIRGA